MRRFVLTLLIAELFFFNSSARQRGQAAAQGTLTERVYLPLVIRWLPPVEMITIPEGYFLMGCSIYDPACHSNEYPLHKVYLSEYEIDRYEVTNEYYAECVIVGVCKPPATSGSITRGSYYYDAGYRNYPVIAVNWYQALTYCHWRGKRLPTEAQWEKAARGPSGTPVYPWGNASPACSLMSYMNNVGEYCVGDTTPAGSYPAGISPYGVNDLAGNVWEWTTDWYSEDYYSRYPVNSWPVDPSGPASGITKVIRGGAWDMDSESARNSRRQNGLPYDLDTATGFRCVR